MIPRKVFQKSYWSSFHSSTLSSVCKYITGQREDWPYDSASRKLITDTTELRGLINSSSFLPVQGNTLPSFFIINALTAADRRVGLDKELSDPSINPATGSLESWRPVRTCWYGCISHAWILIFHLCHSGILSYPHVEQRIRTLTLGVTRRLPFRNELWPMTPASHL